VNKMSSIRGIKHKTTRHFMMSPSVLPSKPELIALCQERGVDYKKLRLDGIPEVKDRIAMSLLIHAKEKRDGSNFL